MTFPNKLFWSDQKNNVRDPPLAFSEVDDSVFLLSFLLLEIKNEN